MCLQKTRVIKCPFNNLLHNECVSSYVFESTYTFVVVILVSTNQYDFMLFNKAMMNALFVYFHREKLGSSSPERRQLHCTLTGSVLLVMATNLKRRNRFNCPLTSLGIIIFVLQINIFNFSVPCVCWSFN